MLSPTEENVKWERLLEWLAGHGMSVDGEGLLVERRQQHNAGYGLFALKSCPPGSMLFTIPAGAMVNVRTLSPHYPSDAGCTTLTATQLVSLHLALYRPEDGLQSKDPFFGPYISVLPQEFDSHPLTWLVKQQERKSEPVEDHLLQNLPPSTTTALAALATRYHTDWKAVCQYMQDSSMSRLPVSKPPSTEDYLWAWLNVNTRCLYHQLKPSRSDPDNLTLCPIVDLANHSSHRAHLQPRRLPSQAVARDGVSLFRRNDDFVVVASADATIEMDCELFLTYGAHSNRTLFVEYGFVNDISREAILQGDIHAEVEVQDLLERLFDDKQGVGRQMKVVLEEVGYWGNWTLHSSLGSSYPSFRVIAALRLYHINLDDSSYVQRWRETLVGQRDTVSEANESAWRDTAVQICATLIERATEGMGDLGTDKIWIHQNIRTLWLEEMYVAEAVSESIRNGEQF